MPDPNERPARAGVVSRRALFGLLTTAGAVAALSADRPSRRGPSVPTAQRTDGMPSEAPTLAPVPTPPPTPTPTVAPEATPVPVTLSVWAHPDDDLIFGFRHVAGALAAGGELRTVFLTSGDAGRGEEYARGRERGIMAAYDLMRGRKKASWTRRELVLLSGVRASVYEPADDPSVRLHFLGLPDGNLTGEGFSATGGATLGKLTSGRVASLRSLDGSYEVTLIALQQAIEDLIVLTRGSTLLTHIPDGCAESSGDHPDHATVGHLAREAWLSSRRPAHALVYAMGYPCARLPQNVVGRELAHKFAVFAAYSAHDPVVGACVTQTGCLHTHGFGRWIPREYTFAESQLFPVE